MPLGSYLVRGDEHASGIIRDFGNVSHRSRLSHALDQVVTVESMLARIVFKQRMNKSHPIGLEREPPVHDRVNRLDPARTIRDQADRTRGRHRRYGRVSSSPPARRSRPAGQVIDAFVHPSWKRTAL